MRHSQHTYISRSFLFLALLSHKRIFRGATALTGRRLFVAPDANKDANECQSVGSGNFVEDRGKEEQDGKMTELRFGASTRFKTEPVPRPRPSRGETMSEFFSLKQYRDCIFSAKPGSTVEECGPPSPEELKRWTDEATRLGASMGAPVAIPSHDDKLVRLRSPGMSFPGIKLVMTTTMGTKLILPPVAKRMFSTDVEYQFTLLDEELKAVGPKALVWLFNKLTGAHKSTESEPMSHIFSRVYAEPINGGSDVVFKNHATVEIRVKFPSLLLRLIPFANKEKIEKKNSFSIQKTLDEDAPLGMNKFRDAYLEWRGKDDGE